MMTRYFVESCQKIYILYKSDLSLSFVCRLKRLVDQSVEILY